MDNRDFWDSKLAHSDSDMGDTMTLDDISQYCHEYHRYFNEAHDDFSYQKWIAMTDEQKEPRIVGVEFVLSNPNCTPEQRHHLWVASMLAQGWRLGERKDPVNRTHNLLVTWRIVPLNDRLKNYFHIMNVRRLHLRRPRVYYSSR